MTRIALIVEYDGADYHGWQSQVDVVTVQATLEVALSEVADHPVQVICAGRTDAGVHATAQVVHFDTTAKRELKAWIFGANRHLPKSISVRWAGEVSEDFHARFSAVSRRYQFIVCNTPNRPSLLRHHMTWCYYPLDVSLMQQGAKHLLGEHDFSAFRGAQCQAKSPVKTLHALEIERLGDIVIFRVHANAFLHHMVRNLAGTLFQVGCGKQPPDWIKTVLTSHDRKQAGLTAPASGLFLVNVEYPEKFAIPPGYDMPGLAMFTS